MASATPEQMKAGMDPWMAWAKKAGAPLWISARRWAMPRWFKKGAVTASGTMVTGYSILQSPSIDIVTALLKDHPHLHMSESSIEILESLPIPGM
jgi:hypothetical protein